MQNVSGVVEQLKQELERAKKEVERFSAALDGLGKFKFQLVIRWPSLPGNGGELCAFAGWDRWKDRCGNAVETCSILTTTPNAVTSAVHHRMPVILDPDSYDMWLDPGMRDAAAATANLSSVC